MFKMGIVIIVIPFPVGCCSNSTLGGTPGSLQVLALVSILSVSLFLGLSPTLRPEARAECAGIPRRETHSLFPCALPHRPPPPAKFRPSAGTHGGGRDGDRAGRGTVPGRPPRAAPDLGASFCSRKGGNGSEKGSAWSRSPGEEVGVGTRTRALGSPGPLGRPP